ncbi:MAG: Sec-independent protein translocase protein TatB [Proteobacteria bacterium]|nr:Sec-independent protein translocase protein TatB [Pseudomonadota bacterium]
MFDVGFWELVIIAIVGLIIIGPERLPKFARDAGRFFAKFRRFIQTAKRDLEKELELDQINDLQKSINHIDGLMKEAPDRIIMGQSNNNNDSESTK